MIAKTQNMIVNLKKSGLLESYPSLEVCADQILAASNMLANSFKNGGKLLVMGNGGSSADAEHIVGELMKGFASPRTLSQDEARLFASTDPGLAKHLQGALPAISLGVSHSLISAFCNDKNPEYVFAQQVWGLAQPGDVVLGISTSGGSKNIIHGLDTARVRGAGTILLTGNRPNALGLQSADISIQVPASETHKIQELHLPVYHAICFELEHFFFPA